MLVLSRKAIKLVVSHFGTTHEPVQAVLRTPNENSQSGRRTVTQLQIHSSLMSAFWLSALLPCYLPLSSRLKPLSPLFSYSSLSPLLKPLAPLFSYSSLSPLLLCSLSLMIPVLPSSLSLSIPLSVPQHWRRSCNQSLSDSMSSREDRDPSNTELWYKINLSRPCHRCVLISFLSQVALWQLEQHPILVMTEVSP